MKMWLSMAVVCLSAGAASGQVFTVLPDGPALDAAWQVEGPRPVRGAVVGVDLKELRGVLDKFG